MADLATTVANWVGSAGRAQTRYSAGIQSSTKDQAGLAVAAQGKLLANVTQAISSGYWARRVQEKGTAYWKAQSLAKASNFGTGFAAGEQNFQQAMQTWLPITMANAATVKSMPSNTFQDSLNRMTQFATLQHNAKLAR